MVVVNMAIENCRNGIMICFDDNLTNEQIKSFVKGAKKKLLQVPTKPKKLQNMCSTSRTTVDADKDNQINNGSVKKNLKTNKEVPLSDCSIYVALDCEFVGVGPRGSVSALGRCTIVDFNGHCLLDIYAKPEEPITDYRTRWSGIRRRDMYNAVPFEFAQNSIKKILQGKVLVGHALHNDIKVLKLNHPQDCMRDTSKCFKLKNKAGLAEERQPASLKRLSKLLLGRDIQKKSHCSLEDARATMDLFKVSMNKLTPVTPQTSVPASEKTKQEAKIKQNGQKSMKRSLCAEGCDIQPVSKKVKQLGSSSCKDNKSQDCLIQSGDEKYMCDSPWYHKINNTSVRHSISFQEANHSYFSDHYWPDDIDFTADITI